LLAINRPKDDLIPGILNYKYQVTKYLDNVVSFVVKTPAN